MYVPKSRADKIRLERTQWRVDSWVVGRTIEKSSTLEANLKTLLGLSLTPLEVDGQDG